MMMLFRLRWYNTTDLEETAAISSTVTLGWGNCYPTPNTLGDQDTRRLMSKACSTVPDQDYDSHVFVCTVQVLDRMNATSVSVHYHSADFHIEQVKARLCVLARQFNFPRVSDWAGGGRANRAGLV